jgi:hypothetical protein
MTEEELFEEKNAIDSEPELKNTIDAETELKLLQEILVALQHLSAHSRKKLIRTLLAFFEISPSELVDFGIYNHLAGAGGAEEQTMSPMEFIQNKQPQTDAERVACLGYYLTHFRGTPHFKTTDVSKLNLEAKQQKFANSTKAINSASKAGYLISNSKKGIRKLSAAGERFVKALPDSQVTYSMVPTLKAKRKVKKEPDMLETNDA